MSQSPAQYRASQKGGLKTLEALGKGHYSMIGAMGGRPRKLNIDELRASRSGSNKEDGQPVGISFINTFKEGRLSTKEEVFTVNPKVQ
jgi:hypothetical protein